MLPASSSPPRVRITAVAFERKRILLAALDRDLADRVDPAFARFEFDVDRAPTLRHATKLSPFRRYDLIVAAFRADDADVEALLAAARAPGSANSSARLALLAAPEELAAARLLREKGCTGAFATNLPRLELQAALLDLLRTRARLAVRFLTRVAIRLADSAETQLLCPTRDLSATGLFVSTESRFPIGSLLRFTLDLPDGGEAIRGVAAIARHSTPERESGDGMGLRFVELAGDGERRLAAFLARNRAGG